MKKGIIILLITCVSGLIFCGGKKYEWSSETKFSLTQVQEDLHQLENLIIRNHPKTFTDMSELMKTIETQYALLTDSMTFLDFYRVVAHVTAKVRCGHTRIWPPESVEKYMHRNGHYLPLDIRVLNDHLYVYKTLTDSIDIKPGTAILAINDDSALAIIEKIKACLYADGQNETFKYYLMNEDHNDFKILYMRFVNNSERHVLSLWEPESDEIREISVRGYSRREIWKYVIDYDIYPDIPLITNAIHKDYAYLKIRFFDYYDDLDVFKAEIDPFFREVSERGLQSLVLDLRGNDGGDPYSSAYLLRYLINKPFQYYAGGSTFLYGDLKKRFNPHDNVFTGDLYVLVDGGCFSTTGHFLSHLKEHSIGTFIGEETSGSYICNSGYKEVQLKHTGINLLLPHTAFITDVSSLPLGKGIPPDYEIHPTISDLIDNRDSVLNKAISLIRDVE